MAKAFLMRTDKDAKFQTIKLEFREPGFSNDLEKLYIGGAEGNIHIPNEDYVTRMIEQSLSADSLLHQSTSDLQVNQTAHTIAFNTDLNKLVYKVSTDASIAIPSSAEVPMGEQNTVTISSANIDSNDGSVIFADFNRTLKMIFIDGILCTNNSASEKRYTFDSATNTLKVFGASDGSIVSYF